MPSIPDLLPLLRELNDLKRVRVAARAGSLAEQLFVRAWARLVRGEELQSVARGETARALVALRLGGVDAGVLEEAGLARGEVLAVSEGAFDAVAGGLKPDFAAALRSALSGEAAFEPETGEAPPFVQLLTRQPRAGATRSEGARLMLEPSENHAEHCALVALYSFLVASFYGGSPERAFLTGLCHHLHNAYLPDAGKVGAMLLGPHGRGVIDAFRARAIATLPPPLRDAVRAALDAVYRSDTPEAKAFQAANALDGVLELEWHARVSRFSLAGALEGEDTPHPGPVHKFRLDLLRETGFLSPADAAQPAAPLASAYHFAPPEA